MKKDANDKKVARHYKYKRRAVIVFSLVILALIYFFNNADFIIRAFTTVIFIILFYVIDHIFDLRYKKYHYIFIVVISLTSFLFSPLYYLYTYYDKVLHFVLPILLSSLIFYLVSRLKLELKWKIIFTFFIVVACLGLFEIGEYLLDFFFDMKLQGVFLRNLQTLEKFHIVQPPLEDTMSDLMFGVAGSTLYAVFIYIFRRKLKLIR